MNKVHIIHENAAWLPPLRDALADGRTPYTEWHLDSGHFDFSAPPPAGVFYNRMSASSHTRGHVHAPEYTASVLAWLEAHGRRVVNNSRALELEVSKVKQYAALGAFGIRVPRTMVAVGKDSIRQAAREFGAPLMLKPNRGGKGAGVQLFQTVEAVDRYLDSDSFDAGPDGTVLIQQYIQSVDGAIVRCEFVGGKFLYAVRVDTSQGFELCPADVCQIEDQACPVGETPGPRFEILDNFEHPNIARYEAFLAANGIEVSGIELIFDKDGTAWTYDVNTNTNYNDDAEANAGVAGTPRAGMRALARFLDMELALQSPAIPAAAE
ncbi:MAG: alpha-L-glutamate ligase [Alphaproteobacteria bacterium]|nr:alpha-L-glutamate ligase [Alphaproteobacteria bacterium]